MDELRLVRRIYKAAVDGTRGGGGGGGGERREEEVENILNVLVA